MVLIKKGALKAPPFSNGDILLYPVVTGLNEDSIFDFNDTSPALARPPAGTVHKLDLLQGLE